MDLSAYFNFENNAVTYGLTGELIAFYMEKLYKEANKNIILVTSNLYESNKLYNIISNHAQNIALFPMDDFITSQVIAMSPEFQIERLNTLEKIKKDPQIIITNLMGYLKFLPSKTIDNNIKLEINASVKPQDLVSKLIDLGYKKESIVTMSGEFSVRGFIIDIFPLNETHPIRIEFFGNTIESIRYFDENTQRTISQINTIHINAFQEVDTIDKNSLYDYCDDPIVVYYNKTQIDVAYEKLCEEIINYKNGNDIDIKYMYEFDDIHPKYELYIDNINNISDVTAKELPAFNEDFELLKDNVFKWEKQNKEVYFYLSKDSEIKKIKKIMPNAKIIKQKISKGFIFQKYVCIGESDIGLNILSPVKHTINFHVGKKIKSYNDLEKGDFVVHINHGIGIYNGLVTLTKDGLKKDYIQLLYDGNDKIYIPVEKINSIYKYSGKDSIKPKLNKLNSSSWAKTKTYVKQKAKDISRELLALYTKRAQIKGEAYKDFEEQEIFASGFEYTPTRDQDKAITEINSDLNSAAPMDRLLW